MGNLNGDSRIVKIEEPATLMDDNRTKQSHVIAAGSLVVMYNVLVQILRLKYIGRKETPFETQSFLIRISILAFLVAGLTLPILIRDYVSKSTTKTFIKIAFWVAGLVAYLSLGLILIID